MSGFTIIPDDLHAAGAALEQAGADLHGHWQQLKAQTLAIKFGQTDMVSPLIQISLMGAVEIAEGCFTTSKDALAGHAAALRSAAEHYRSAEAGSTALFKES